VSNPFPVALAQSEANAKLRQVVAAQAQRIRDLEERLTFMEARRSASVLLAAIMGGLKDQAGTTP
jgi:nitrogen-specific signal transduction histidine kinase